MFILNNGANMFDIYFKDLKPEVQKELLEWCDVEDEYTLNWDVFPLASIEKPYPGWDFEIEVKNND